MASSSAHFFLASSIAFMSRFSAGVRTSPQNTARNAAWKVNAQSIQRSASARTRSSFGHRLPAPCLAAR